jgi:hypothetical protein
VGGGKERGEEMQQKQGGEEQGEEQQGEWGGKQKGKEQQGVPEVRGGSWLC